MSKYNFTPNDIEKFKQICNKHKLNIMPVLIKHWKKFRKPHVRGIIEFIELIDGINKLKSQRDKNALYQYSKGFLAEQGITDEWLGFLREIIILENQVSDLHLKYKQTDEYSAWLKREHEINDIISKHSFSAKQRLQFISDKCDTGNKEYDSKMNVLFEERRDLRKKIHEKPNFIQNCKQNSRIHYLMKKAFEETEFIANTELAHVLYENAFMNGAQAAAFQLGLFHLKNAQSNDDIEYAFDLIQQAADAGVVIANYIIAECYRGGVLFEKDDVKSHDKILIAKESKEKDLIAVLIYLIKSYLCKTTMDLQNEFADEFIQEGEDNGLKYEQLKLIHLVEVAKNYLNEMKITPVKQKYIQEALIESENQKIKAEFTSAILKEQGLSDLSIYSISSYSYIHPISDINDYIPHYAAGACYYGVENIYADDSLRLSKHLIQQDTEKSLAIWKVLAEKNDPIALYRLGRHYVSLSENDVNIKIAIDYLNQSAKLGFKMSNIELSRLYFFTSSDAAGLNHILDLLNEFDEYNEVKAVTKFSCFANFDRVLFGPHYSSINFIHLLSYIFSKKIECIEDLDARLGCFIPAKFEAGLDDNDYLKRKKIVLSQFENHKNDLAHCLLLQYHYDALQAIFSVEEYPVRTNPITGAKEQVKSINRILSFNIIDENIEPDQMLIGMISMIEDSQYDASYTKLLILCGNEYIFNTIFSWLIERHYNPLLLGCLHWYRAKNDLCKASEDHLKLALRWFKLEKNSALAALCQAYILEVEEPEAALKALDEIDFDSLAAGQEQKEQIENRLKFFKLKIQSRIKLRIKALEAQRHSEHVEMLKTRLEKLVQRTSHTLANTIFPNTLYQVAEHIKDKAEHRHDALLLLDAYHAEVSIRHENELLQQRYTTDNPEPLRQILRGDRRPLPDSEARSIEQLIDYALSRVLSRLLNTQSPKLNAVRRQILGDRTDSVNDLRMDFEDAMFFREPRMTALAWCSHYVRPIELIYRESLWQEVGLKREGLAEALLYGHFAELLLNAFKYADHAHVDFLSLELDKATHSGQDYLTMTFSNPVASSGPTGLGSHQGLDALKEDISQLNGAVDQAPTLAQRQENGRFYVQIAYQADLLWLEPLPEIDFTNF